MAEKGGKEGFGFYKRIEHGSVSVSLLIQVWGMFSLVASAYDEMFMILFLFLILFEQHNCRCSELALPNKFSLPKNKGTHAYDHLKLVL